jgi:nucleoside-diphosphate-sugar epimerase
VPANILSSHRLREATGWRPRTRLREGIKQYIHWLQNFRIAHDR